MTKAAPVREGFLWAGHLLLESLDEALKFTHHPPAHYLGTPEELMELPLEKSVHLTGKSNGLVVLRAGWDLGLSLSRSVSSGSGKYPTVEEAFDRLVRLFCQRLISSQSHHTGFQSFLIFTSGPWSWPAQTPLGSCSLEVDNHPLEIRVWALTKSRSGRGGNGNGGNT